MFGLAAVGRAGIWGAGTWSCACAVSPGALDATAEVAAKVAPPSRSLRRFSFGSAASPGSDCNADLGRDLSISLLRVSLDRQGLDTRQGDRARTSGETPIAPVDSTWVERMASSGRHSARVPPLTRKPSQASQAPAADAVVNRGSRGQPERRRSSRGPGKRSVGSSAWPSSSQASSLDINATIVRFTAEMRTMPAAIM